nr:hypothetical protein [Methylobacterium sp. Leaf118]
MVGGGPRRITCDVGVSLRRVRIPVSEDRAEQGQTASGGSSDAGKGVTEIVKSHIREAGARSYALPDLRQLDEVIACDTTNENVRILIKSRLCIDQGQCRRSDGYRLRTRLARRKAKVPVLPINMGPLELEQLGLPGPVRSSRRMVPVAYGFSA